jgi:hypothetical protein
MGGVHEASAGVRMTSEPTLLYVPLKGVVRDSDDLQLQSACASYHQSSSLLRTAWPRASRLAAVMTQHSTRQMLAQIDSGRVHRAE